MKLPKLKLVSDRVAVKPDTKDDSVTDSGLHVVRRWEEEPRTGEVIATGPGLRTLMGETMPMTIQVGDIVIFEPAQAMRIALGEDAVLIFDEEMILAIIDEEEK